MADIGYLSELLRKSKDMRPSPLTDLAIDPNDPNAPQQNPDYDPADDMPAIEDEQDVAVNPNAPLMSQSTIDQIQSIPLPDAQKSLRVPAETAAQPMMPTQDKASILSDFQRLKNAQSQRQSDMGSAMMFAGGNKIAQGLARGYGAEIGDNSEGVKMLQDQANLPVSDIEAQMKLGGTDMNDPASDISKFTRQQAYALLKKMDPKTDYAGRLEEMSAMQLSKLPGMKNAMGSSSGPEWVATDRVTKDGSPIKFNKRTGTYANGLTGEALEAGAYAARDILRKDQLTGNYGIGTAQGMTVLPTNYGGMKPVAAKENPETGKVEDVKYGDFAKQAPKQAEEFRKMQIEFNKDMKDSREIATSTTNLSHKLTPGPNGEIDSGLLGGIQTQAAKMAGQKGVLTDQDLVKFAGAGGVAAKLERIKDGSLFGDMSDSDVKFFKRFAELMNHSLESDIQNRSQLYKHQAKQLVETTVPGITDENIANWLGVDKVAPAVQDHTATSGEVKRKTADGKIAIFDSKTKKFLRYEGENK